MKQQHTPPQRQSNPSNTPVPPRDNTLSNNLVANRTTEHQPPSDDPELRSFLCSKLPRKSVSDRLITSILARMRTDSSASDK